MIKETHKANHTTTVRLTHLVVSLSIITLLVSGFVILMAHPRLYWGEVGNDLTKPLFELPISKNYKHGGWTPSTAFYSTLNSPVSASRTFDIFNQNGWARSLHFMAGWLLVGTGAVYLIYSLFSGHIRNNILPRSSDFNLKNIIIEIKEHALLQIRAAAGGPNYGILQKISYFIVIFIFVPGTVVTGLTMSPAITAAHPILLDIFGGYQSARTIHFILAAILLLFTGVHVFMVIKSGFKKQMKSMFIGR
jgi:thiosulfate reductase cytochrome b subunit